eukprot:4762590-Pyramimonas_sp.AAC.1
MAHGIYPRISALAEIADDNPTYVDDLAALLSSTKQALRAAIAPPWAARAAGFLVEAHRCQSIRATKSAALRTALAEAPVDFESDGDDVIIIGPPSELILTLLSGNAQKQ